ncbi:MAG: hypothetical protein HOV68_09750 [Streptomycetaceae bacterium]|nr:hypothetical protein [Streptomycetaceae bacterium]
MDDTVDRALKLVHDYSARGPLTLKNMARGDREEVVVEAIAPLPQALPRLVADALTQLRAALEHALYAEVEAQLARPLTDEAPVRIEVPACATATAWTKWLGNTKRSQLAPLRAGSPLAQRLERLQPFQRNTPDDHPLQLLVKHTNTAKHRNPAQIATRIGTIYPDDPASPLEAIVPPDLRPQPGGGAAVRVGDTIASAPRGRRIEFSVFPTVCLRRPHTGVWTILAHELQYLEEWVRTVALPVLLAGRHDLPLIPPQLDIATGCDDVRGRLANAGTVPAADRSRARFEAATARTGLVDVLAPHSFSPNAEVVRAWVAALTEADAVERVNRLASVRHDPVAILVVFRALISEARAYAERPQ